MLLFFIFLLFLLHDVQLVILNYRIVLYRTGNCCDYLQVFPYDPRAGCCLSVRSSAYSLWTI